MQITRTEVARMTHATGHPIVRVTFCGEGGECVTVDMANVDEQPDNAALDRARAILVQTATFNLAANDYDAQSNGNFGQVSLTAASDQTGAAYIFEYREGDSFRHSPAAALPSLDDAREEAIRCAIDMLIDLQPGTDDLTGPLVRVRGRDGQLLCEIGVQEAQAARQTRQ